MVAICENAPVREMILFRKKATTFQHNSPVVFKNVWFELDLNLSHSYFEKSSLDRQCSTAVDPNVAVQNQLVCDKTDTANWTNVSRFK